MMDTPSTRKRSEKPSDPKRLASELQKPILESLNADGSMDMSLLKRIAKGCLECLNGRKTTDSFLGNIIPEQVFYQEVGEKIKITFKKQRTMIFFKPTLNSDSLSAMKWMAPEIIQKISKPTLDSDVFTLGLLFFYLFTQGGSPLVITTTFSKNEANHHVHINLQLLKEFQTDTESILFTNLMQKMLIEVPSGRENYKKLLDHAVFMNNKARLQIIRDLARKMNTDIDSNSNEFLEKIMNKNEVHMEGFRGTESAEWKEFLAADSYYKRPDIRSCSVLVMTLQYDDIRDYDVNLLIAIMKLLPNFFPHVYNIYREELAIASDWAFNEIFDHFNDAQNALGTGSYGTIVYKGNLRGRNIAIKRVLKTVSKAVEREISIMIKIDRHPNILRYFAKEEDKNFIFIGTELCECNLTTFVRDQGFVQKMTAKTIMQQTAEGLNYLHQLHIIHRDIKPENILICHDNETYSIKLSDFGISKALNLNTTKSTLHAPGTPGWIAPEVSERGHNKLSDVFSLGCVFYFVISNGTILCKELRMNYSTVEIKLKEKLQKMTDQGHSKQFLHTDLLIRMLKFDQELRPSTRQILLHPLFWADKTSLAFILEIRKRFEVLEPQFVRKIKNEHQKVLEETPILKKLKAALDLDKSVVTDDWKAKLDPILADDLNASYKSFRTVSELLRAIRNKWTHKGELTDTIKDLFGKFTEAEYLNYFTARFPRLLIHCYNSVEREARDLFGEYFHKTEAPTAALAKIQAVKDEDIFQLIGSRLIIDCGKKVITFPETRVQFDALEIENISHLLIKGKKSFINFLQKNGSNVTQLEILRGSLKFESLNEILLKLPQLQTIKLYDIAYEASKTKPTIQPVTCQHLIELKIEYDFKSTFLLSNLFHAFHECQTIQRLTLSCAELPLHILQKFSRLDELTVNFDSSLPVSEASTPSHSSIKQLNVLNIKMDTRYDKKPLEKCLSFIQSQSHLQQFSYHSFFNQSQLFCQSLAAHICKLEHLTHLKIVDEGLLEEVEAFVATCSVPNTSLEELTYHNWKLKKTLPSLFFEHFTNLRAVDISCYNFKELENFESLFNFMSNSKLTSIKLRGLALANFQCITKLHVQLLQVLEVGFNNMPKDKVLAFEVLQKVLPKHPSVTDLQVVFDRDYDDGKAQELITMIVGTLPLLERLVIRNYSKITAEIITQIAELKTLQSWKINGFKSETFYEAQN